MICNELCDEQVTSDSFPFEAVMSERDLSKLRLRLGKQRFNIELRCELRELIDLLEMAEAKFGDELD